MVAAAIRTLFAPPVREAVGRQLSDVAKAMHSRRLKAAKLVAHIRTSCLAVGNDKWVWVDSLVLRRQGIEAASQLVDLPRAHPARELPLDVVGVDIAGEQQAVSKTASS